MCTRSASRLCRLLVCLSILATPLFAKTGASSVTGPMWIELGPGGQIIARDIAPNATCPQIDIDGKLSDMTARAPQTLPAFPVTACEAVIPPGAKSVSILKQSLVLPVARPKRLVIIGDTGCRIKGDKVQDCESGKKWPFHKLAKQAAAWKPQLVIHVGDYLYRESECPDPKKCDSSPWGDNWPTWTADFFSPGTSLLAVAPWVMARGNHEDCDRAGAGYFRFLETTVIQPDSPVPPPCTEYTNPYAVPIGDVTLLMLDSSAVKPLTSSESDDDEAEEEDGATATDTQEQTYAKQFTELWGMAGTNNWLLMHHPLRAARHAKGGDGAIEKVTDTLWTAAGDVPSSLDLIVTGHIHFTEALTFDGHPSQLVLGGGGTKLTKDVKDSDVNGKSIGGWKVTHARIIDDFGYATVEEKGTNVWDLHVYGTDGTKQMKCSIDGAEMTCKKE
jgi:hypothetical protein